MRPSKNYIKKGFSLVEALLALTIFSMVATAFVGALIYGQQSVATAGEQEQAMLLLEEGMEAVRNLRDESFANLTNGTHGLAISAGKWSLTGSADTTGIYSRSVTISSVDSKTKQAAVAVSWNGIKSGSMSASARFTDWQALNPTEAEQLTANTADAAVGGTGNVNITGVTIEDTGIENITLARTKISWSGVAGAPKLTGIKINGSSVWTGSDSSGSNQDISDFTLNLGGGTYPLELVFDNAVTGISVTIVFTMSDSSTKEVSFTPNSPADTTPPADINNLSVSGATSSSLTLNWTAPGDDNNSGTAASYDIRYSTATITDGNWGSATQVAGEPAPQSAGNNQSLTVSGLSPYTMYYFAMKTSDEVPNISGISNVASGRTAALPQANYLVVNTAGAARSGNTVTGITLQNSGPINITIATMTVSWLGVGGNRRLTSITIGGTSVWTGTATSGTVANITDRALNTGAAAQAQILGFNNTINGIIVSIVYTMTDGSTKTVSSIGPLP